MARILTNKSQEFKSPVTYTTTN